MAYNQIPPNVISTANSTTSNLAGAAVFTGTSEDVSSYSLIQVSVFSSHVSATDGLSLQQSSNGTNWDITDVFTIPATTGKVFSIQPAAQYFRLVYTNGATLTTSLRIQTVYHWQPSKASAQRPQDALSNENDFEQVWAMSSLYNGTTWDRMRGDTTNGLDVDVTRMAALVTGSATVGFVGVNGSGTTSIAKLEDVGHSTGDMGVPAWGVRNDTMLAPTSATADYSQLSVGPAGELLTAGAPRLLKARQVTIITASTTETTIVSAIASTFNDIYGLILTNTSATATEVTIRDATAGGTISSFMVPAGDSRGFMLPVDSAVPQATVNNNWTATCSTSVSSLKVTALYVKRV